MNVWIINHYAITPQFSGGTRHYEFSRFLANQNHLVTLWMCSFLHHEGTFIGKEQRKQAKESVPENLYLNWSWAPAYQKNNIFRALNMMIFTFLMFFKGLLKRERPDVIVASSPHLFACLSGWALAKIKRSYFIFEIRDLWPEALIAMGANLNRPAIKILSCIENFLYKRSVKIIVVSEGIRDTLIDRGISPQKIVFIPNGIYLKDITISVSREELRKQCELKNNFVALYCGSHAFCYALDTVLEAAAYLNKIKDIKIVMLGDGPEKSRLKTKAKDMGLNNVVFLDSVPKSEVPEYLNMADILILTTQDNYVFQRARPNKLFDYLASGKTILCAVEGEMRKVVENCRAGIAVKPEDPYEMAKGIKCLYENQHLFSRWENNAWQYVREYCDREKHAAQFEQLLFEATKQSSSQRRNENSQPGR